MIMQDQNDNLSNLKNELRILTAMRKTLSSVVKDVTPNSTHLKSPLKQTTTDDIIMCFGLITAREQEIAKLLKTTQTHKPRFIDEHKTSHSVSLDSLRASLKKQE